MNLLYDNIIFELQQSGGISLYWSELIKRQLDNNNKILFLEGNSKVHKNIFRKLLPILSNHIIKDKTFLPLKIKRYLPISKGKKFDIIHSSYYRTTPKKSNNINIVTVHDFIYEHYFKGLKKNIHSTQKHKALKNADGIICISQSTKTDLLKFYPNLSSKPIRVIHHGVSNEYKIVNCTETYIKEKYRLNNPYILYIGSRNIKYKNFILTVESVENSLGYTLVIVGGGNLKTDEIKLLEKKLQNKYLHLQYLPHQELNILYNNAHCLLYPSLYEGFGLPLIEAQKAGCPIIAFNNSSIPEIVSSKLALLNNLTINEITQKIKLLKNIHYRQQEINNGLDNIKNFCWDKCYKETTDFYSEVHKRVLSKKVLSSVR